MYFRVLRELTAACQQEGSISPQRDGQELVADLVALHRGMLFEWRIYEKGFDLVTRGRRMAAALLICQLFGNPQIAVDIGSRRCHNVNSSLNDSVKFCNFPMPNTKKGENR